MTRVKRISKQDVDKYEAAKARSQSGKPPPPFVETPPRLEAFTDTLDITHVYITHVDRFPAAFKQRIFTVPVILNVAIVLFLVWRGWYIVPTYMAMLSSILGYISSANVDTASSTYKQLAWIGLKRGLNFMLDFVLLTVILPWPISFFLEQPGNPTSWRFNVGFQNEEIVVRESRKWGTEELMRGVKTGEDSPFFKTRIMPAIDKRYIREKTGYMMMDKNWDLDFYAMTQAHKLIKEKKLQTNDFEKTIWAHHATLGWLYWPVYKMDEVGAEEEQRKKIVELKDKLTAMGKESLFFRWIEIVQYETSRPGEFSVQRQNETLAKVKAAFDEQGVNFEELIKEVGGLEGTPGNVFVYGKHIKLHLRRFGIPGDQYWRLSSAASINTVDITKGTIPTINILTIKIFMEESSLRHSFSMRSISPAQDEEAPPACSETVKLSSIETITIRIHRSASGQSPPELQVSLSQAAQPQPEMLSATDEKAYTQSAEEKKDETKKLTPPDMIGLLILFIGAFVLMWFLSKHPAKPLYSPPTAPTYTPSFPTTYNGDSSGW